VDLHYSERRIAHPAVLVDGQQLIATIADYPITCSSSTFEDGMPFVLDPEGQLEWGLQTYFTYLRADVEISTIRSYAKDLVLFWRFLEVQRAKTPWTADLDDVAAYRAYRLHGPLSARLARSSWARNVASLQRFYDWAHDTDRVSIPLRVKTRRDRKVQGTGFNLVSMKDYITVRKVGLLGLTPEGGSAFMPKSRYPLRDAAFFELLVCTGLRRDEANSLLLGELPDPDGPDFIDKRNHGLPTEPPARLRQSMLDVPGSITKNRVARRTPYPRRVASSFLLPYLKEERPLLVEKWRDSGGVNDHGKHTIFALRIGPQHIRPFVDLRSRTLGRKVKTAALTKEERQRLVLLPDAAAPLSTAEPAALWIGENARPLRPTAWNQILERAKERCLRICGLSICITPHTCRHIFATYTLSALIKAQAVQLDEFARLKRDADGQGADAVEIYRRVVGDPLRIVQQYLGHASQITTQVYLSHVADAHQEIEDAMGLLEATSDHSSIMLR
jgi:site-specific recombinase XerD